MQRRSVDLPEPDAPIRQTTLCRSTLRSTCFEHLELAERLAHVLDRDEGPAAVLAHGKTPVARSSPLARAIRWSVKRASGIVSRMKNVAATTYEVKFA